MDMVKAKCLKNGKDCDRSVLQEDYFLGFMKREKP